MKLFRLSCATNLREIYVKFSDRDMDKVFRYFLMDKKDIKLPEKLRAYPQCNLTDTLIETLDYLEAIISVPVFSSRFFEKCGDILRDEIDFYPVTIVTSENEFPFYIGDIKNKIKLVDYKASEYMATDNDDEEDFLYNEVLKSTGLKSFYIARDKKDVVFIVSEKFKALTVDHNLNMRFFPVRN